MNELPLNDVSTFGAAAHHGGSLSAVDLVAEAPPADPSRPRPAVRRVLSADGANLIVFNFYPAKTCRTTWPRIPSRCKCCAAQ